MYTYRWPWTAHRCQNTRERGNGVVWQCESADSMMTIQCWTCTKHYCDECGCDACRGCGRPTCPKCRRNHNRFDCVQTWVPFLVDYPMLQCVECNAAPADVSGHHCEICQLPQCLNNECASILMTCHGPCRRDICNRWRCARTRYKRRFNSRVIIPFRSGRRVNESLPTYIGMTVQRWCHRDFQPR